VNVLYPVLEALGAAFVASFLFAITLLVLVHALYWLADHSQTDVRPTKDVERFVVVLATLMAGLAVVIVMLWRWTPTQTAVLGLLLAAPTLALLGMRERSNSYWPPEEDA